MHETQPIRHKLSAQEELPLGLPPESGHQTGGYQRPFLKWAGNKFQILGAILAALPKSERLVEPFAGSGAVFLNAGSPRYLVADTNPTLIDSFLELKKDSVGFIKDCRVLFSAKNNTEVRFYELRDEFNKTKNSRRKAELFIYLNRHCFNGLCRFNRKGEFKVPFGRYTAPKFPEKELGAFAAKAKSAEFRCQDFMSTMDSCRKGDVVYCDPPYVPLSPTASFTAYSLGGFGEKQQRELADMARGLVRKGLTVVISNHDTPLTRELYAGAALQTIDVQRFISCDGANRGKAKELIAIFSP